MTPPIANTSRTLASMLVALLEARDRAAFFRDARLVLAEVARIVDEEEQRERGQPYR